MTQFKCSCRNEAIYRVEHTSDDNYSQWFSCEACLQNKLTKRGAEHLAYTLMQPKQEEVQEAMEEEVKPRRYWVAYVSNELNAKGETARYLCENTKNYEKACMQFERIANGKFTYSVAHNGTFREMGDDSRYTLDRLEMRHTNKPGGGYDVIKVHQF